jgi:RNA polymerase sigma-70 factor (ECF subfamily)
LTDSPDHNSANAFADDEGLLLHELAQGSTEAFSVLYKRCQPKLSRFLYPFRTVEDPREIIQDIFLKIWEKREVMPAIRSFEQYLYRMAKNRLIDVRKSNHARQERQLSTYKTSGDKAALAFEAAEYREVYETAMQAIKQLNERQQLIYRLRVFDDLSLDEISTRLSLSKSVVIKQLYLATKFIRERLGSQQALQLLVTIGLSMLWLKKLFFK